MIAPEVVQAEVAGALGEEQRCARQHDRDRGVGPLAESHDERPAPRTRARLRGNRSRLRRSGRGCQLHALALLAQLRRALAQPLPAIRALGDVRAHLRAAVLADDVEVDFRHAGKDSPVPPARRPHGQMASG